MSMKKSPEVLPHLFWYFPMQFVFLCLYMIHYNLLVERNIYIPNFKLLSSCSLCKNHAKSELWTLSRDHLGKICHFGFISRNDNSTGTWAKFQISVTIFPKLSCKPENSVWSGGHLEFLFWLAFLFEIVSPLYAHF